MALALQSLAGLIVIPLLAWACSEDRAAFLKRPALIAAAGAIGLQVALALVLLKVPASHLVFDALTHLVNALQKATDEGARLVFGYLAGGALPFDERRPEAGYILAFRALPMILVLAAVVRLLYYWGILQVVVRGLAAVLARATGIGGPLSTVSASAVFVGLIEAPLVIRPYLRDMDRPSFFAMITVALSTVAGTVMALYAGILQPLVPGAAGHLFAGSLMNVPAALLLARIVIPGKPAEAAPAVFHMEHPSQSVMDAIAQGAYEGLRLVAMVAATLVVMVSLVALLNSVLALLSEPLGFTFTLQRMLGIACAPLAWLIGIPWSETGTAGALLGQKFVLNEFIAYLDLARTPEAAISPRSRLILTYALCSFANLGSLGIMIGGLTAMCPERRSEIVGLAPKALVLSFLATLMSGAVIGLVVWG